VEYIIEMQTVVETPSYLKAADNLFSEEERAAIVAMVSANPECGDLMGKRGGARVIYILRNEDFPIFLLPSTRRTKSKTSRRPNAMN
jgi:hypothetical protein